MDLFIDRCRLCLEENSDNINIFDGDKNIVVELSTCLSIEITPDDILPKIICRKCVDSLHEFYLFYVNSKQTEKIMLSFIDENNLDTNFSSATITKIDSELSHQTENKYLSEYLDNINSSFDLDVLTNNSRALSALDCLEGSTDIIDVTQKLLNNGVKLKKVPKNCSSNSTDESIEIHMEIDVLDSELDIVNKILAKEARQTNSADLNNSSESFPENYSCLSCKSIFNDFNILSEHMTKCPSIKRVYGNKIHINNSKINKDIKNLNNQRIEIKTSDANCVYRCKKCGIMFESKNLLYTHIKSSHLKSPKYKTSDVISTDKLYDNNKINDSFIYRCKVCHAMCTDKEILYDHIKGHSQDLKTSDVLCDTCGKDFTSYKELSQHILLHI